MSVRPRFVDFARVWTADCEPVLRSLFGQKSAVSGAELYGSIYHLCVAQPRPYVSEVYRQLGVLFVEEAVAARKRLSVLSAAGLVCEYSRSWTAFCRVADQIDAVCLYLNKVILQTKPDPESCIVVVAGDAIAFRLVSVRVLARSMWRSAVLVHFRDQLENRLVGSLLAAINDERTARSWQVDPDVLRAAVGSFEECEGDAGPGFFEAELEEPLLRATRHFYQHESARLIAAKSTADYVFYVEQALGEETQRAGRYLCASSAQRLVNAAESVLIGLHRQKLQEGVYTLLQARRFDELAVVYRLLKRIPDGLEPVVGTFERFVFDSGQALFQTLGTADADVFVTAFSGLYLQLWETTKKAFLGNHRAEAALGRAFSRIVRELQPRPATANAELLALFLDSLLRGETAAASVEAKCESVFIILRHLGDRDLFERHYSKLLAQRLLLRLASSHQQELWLASELYKLCGPELANCLKKMFVDIQMSTQMRAQFKGQCGAPEFAATVLTAFAWPVSAGKQAVVPEELAPCFEAFAAFYLDMHSGRKLDWAHHLSRGNVAFRSHGGREYDLHVTFDQMLVLMAFRHRDRLLVQDLVQETGLDLHQVHTVLQPLILADLLKYEDGGEAAVLLNLSFAHPKTRIRLAPPKIDFSDESDEAARQLPVASDKVDEDRRFFLQALVMRLLKQHRELSPVGLDQLVVEACLGKFVPLPLQLRQVIEMLGEKQYLEYDTKRDLYIYIH